MLIKHRNGTDVIQLVYGRIAKIYGYQFKTVYMELDRIL